MKDLIRFQTDRDLDKKEYDAINEHANIVAELFESIGLDIPKENRPQLKIEFSNFVESLKQTGIALTMHLSVNQTPKEEQVDAYADVITFCTGAILKLGYDPIIAIEECGKEINSREGKMVDGKFEKDTSPEAQAKWHKADYIKAER